MIFVDLSALEKLLMDVVGNWDSFAMVVCDLLRGGVFNFWFMLI